MRAMVIDILVQLNAKSANTAVTFDAENGQCPSFLSINCAYDAGTDVNIAKLWIDNEGMKADYVIPNAEYNDDRYEYNMSLADESCVNYEEILDWLKDKID